MTCHLKFYGKGLRFKIWRRNSYSFLKSLQFQFIIVNFQTLSSMTLLTFKKFRFWEIKEASIFQWFSKCYLGICLFFTPSSSKTQSESQTTQTAHTLYLDRLSRSVVSRHAMLQFHVMFLTDISRPLVAFKDWVLELLKKYSNFNHKT